MVRIIRINNSVFYKHIGTSVLGLLGAKNRNLIQIRVSKKEFVGEYRGIFQNPTAESEAGFCENWKVIRWLFRLPLLGAS